MISELEFILKTAQSLIRQRKLAPAETLLLDKYKKWGNHPLINLALGEIFFLKDNHHYREVKKHKIYSGFESI